MNDYIFAVIMGIFSFLVVFNFITLMALTERIKGLEHYFSVVNDNQLDHERRIDGIESII